MGKKSIETLVGIFVLLGMAGLVFLALKAANLGSFSGTDTYPLSAKFDNIGGLKVRAPVRSAGVTIGRVTGISLDKKSYQGVVTLELNRNVQKHGVQYLQIVGDAFGRPIVDELERAAADGEPYDLSKLAVILSGGAPLSAPLKARFLAAIPHLMLIDGIGSSGRWRARRTASIRSCARKTDAAWSRTRNSAA